MTTGTRGRRRHPRHQTPLLRATARREEGWCVRVRVMTGNGGPTMRVDDDDDSTPHHRCEQLLAGWIRGAEEATRWGNDSQHDATGCPPSACGRLLFTFFRSYFCHSTKEYIS